MFTDNAEEEEHFVRRKPSQSHENLVDTSVCRWLETTASTTISASHFDGRARVTETDLDTGVRRTLGLLRETDLDRAVSMLSLHVSSPVSPDTRRSYGNLPGADTQSPTPDRRLNPAISASELRFIEARERLSPPTWWTERRTSGAVTPSRLKNLERLSRSQLSLGDGSSRYSHNSVAQRHNRYISTGGSQNNSPVLSTRQNRQRTSSATSATPVLTSVATTATCQSPPTSFALPSDELVLIYIYIYI